MTALRVALVVLLWPVVHITDRLRGVNPPARLRAGLDWATRLTERTTR